MSSSNRMIVSILALAALAIAFWMLVLAPKRQEADDLARQAGELRVSLTEARAKAAAAVAARRQFPADYRRLVVLGQAAPAGEETSSLLVELNQIATDSGVEFDSIQLEGAGEEAPAPVATAPVPPPTPKGGDSTGAVPASATVPPTEAAAAILPLGASIGPAGLAVMPYSLSFSGKFFEIADFIAEIDSLVDTGGAEVGVDGRLITLDGFALNADGELKFPHLNATFSVTTYLTPPSQGVTAGATPSAPAPATATPAAGTAPAESAPAEPSASSETSETVAAER